MPFLSLLMMASDRDDAIAVQRRGRELRRRHGFPAVPAAPAQSGGWSRHGQSSPRALPAAFRYAPSSRKDRHGNPASQLPWVNEGCGGMTGGTSVREFMPFTVDSVTAAGSR